MSDPRRGLAVSAWCVVAAFGAYFCMYAFRKPFTAASYAGHPVAGVEFKAVLVIAQVFGYMLSKFIGIKVVSELPPARRVGLILGLIGAAQLALVLFGLTPAPYNAVWLFFNGLPLGMVFGVVTGFLEGRRHTEALTAGLCASFIVADGVVRSAGAMLLTAGVSESWMPAAAGLLFTPPLLLFAWMLARVPPPTEADVEERSERTTLDASQRGAFYARYATGLTLLLVSFALVTVLRSLRGDFAKEVWAGLAMTVEDAVFAQSEAVVGAVVIGLFGATALIRDNRRAFSVALGLSLAGPVLLAAALLGLRGGMPPFAFMVVHGLGLYLPYIAVHTTVFERLIAMTRDRGTIGYLITLADSFGYLGYVAVLLARNLSRPAGEAFLPFFLGVSWATAAACVLLLVPCWIYFAAHPATRRAAA
ncbi:MAG: DUF5690 family protein [Gemmataceae bacterium]